MILLKPLIKLACGAASLIAAVLAVCFAVKRTKTNNRN
ncbi:hypothetical protein CHCC19466_1702 [Bacillus licheniformis]|nr:hypothetical protein B4094_1608 [Bacillus licheniformis]TWN16752.1 hypothetical protein CHCC14564_1317 [Bacillus licheniformis LMG 17339]TWJ89225.1 hypothetical protein CHCC20495_4182 [Bacillus licheniformis]TWK29492.1 hypothetical protein CHCC20369_0839 [Bacillus licheniformis]TWK39481.1 hypothetical protein CHCC20368_3028 [Bacillus licheniformis]